MSFGYAESLLPSAVSEVLGMFLAQKTMYERGKGIYKNFCIKYGIELDKNDKFCSECGTELNEKG